MRCILSLISPSLHSPLLHFLLTSSQWFIPRSRSLVAFWARKRNHIKCQENRGVLLRKSEHSFLNLFLYSWFLMSCIYFVYYLWDTETLRKTKIVKRKKQSSNFTLLSTLVNKFCWTRIQTISVCSASDSFSETSQGSICVRAHKAIQRKCLLFSIFKNTFIPSLHRW